MGTVVGVWTAWDFTESVGVGVEAAEELAKATGVCVRAGPVDEREQSMENPLWKLHGSTDMLALGEERGKAADDMIPDECLLLRRAADGVSR